MSKCLLSRLNPFGHSECNDEIASLIKERCLLTREVQELKSQTVRLMTEVQESKAIYDYQTGELERKIAEKEMMISIRDRTVEDLHAQLRGQKKDYDKLTRRSEVNTGTTCYDLAEELKQQAKFKSKAPLENTKSAERRLGRPKGSLGKRKKRAIHDADAYWKNGESNAFRVVPKKPCN